MAGVDPSQPAGKQPSKKGVPPASPAQPTSAQPKAAAPRAKPVANVPQARAPKPVQILGPTISEDVGSPAIEEGEAAVILRSSPPWLISALLHMVVLIVLGLIVVSRYMPKSVQLVSSQIYGEELGLQTLVETKLGTNTDQMDEPIVTPDKLKSADDPFAAPNRMQIQLDGAAAMSDISAQLGMDFHGRQTGTKKNLLGKFGGSETTEAAVQLGLTWLARQQAADGSWSLVGPYSDGCPSVKGYENRGAATAMALLAFQGAGSTHQSGTWKGPIARGWNWLLKQQDSLGCFFQEGGYNHRFYTQGQATIAICELYAMTKDSSLREPAQRAVRYCTNTQKPKGGWKYYPQDANGENYADVSVTGWVLMALQSARMAGLRVDPEAFTRCEAFLDRVGVEKGSRYRYMEREDEPRLSMTAEGLLCRQYLGWPRTDDRLLAGADWIGQNLIDYRKRNEYYWYYATQVCHHLEGQHWQRWNARLRQLVPEQQEKAGKEAGSWHPTKPANDAYIGENGGRLVVTCLSIYMLEVYYRHMPLYSKIATTGDAIP